MNSNKIYSVIVFIMGLLIVGNNSFSDDISLQEIIRLAEIGESYIKNAKGVAVYHMPPVDTTAFAIRQRKEEAEKKYKGDSSIVVKFPQEIKNKLSYIYEYPKLYVQSDNCFDPKDTLSDIKYFDGEKTITLHYEMNSLGLLKNYATVYTGNRINSITNPFYYNLNLLGENVSTILKNKCLKTATLQIDTFNIAGTELLNGKECVVINGSNSDIKSTIWLSKDYFYMPIQVRTDYIARDYSLEVTTDYQKINVHHFFPSKTTFNHILPDMQYTSSITYNINEININTIISSNEFDGFIVPGLQLYDTRTNTMVSAPMK